MEPPPRCSRGGGARRRVSLPEGQHFIVTGVSLVIDPAASAVAQPSPLVHVWAEVGAGAGAGRGAARTIGKLSLENPVADVRPTVELGDGEFVLCHDSTWSTVRLLGYYVHVVDMPNRKGEGEPTMRRRRSTVEEDIMHADEVPDEEDGLHAEEVPNEEDSEEEGSYAEEVLGVEDEGIYAEEVLDVEDEGIYAEEVPNEEDDMHAEDSEVEEGSYAEEVLDVEEEGIYAEEVPNEEDDMHAEEVLEERVRRVEYEVLTEEDMAERYDSDNGEFGDDGEVEEEDRPPRKQVGDGGGEAAAESSERKRDNSIGLVDAAVRVLVLGGEFVLGPAQFAAVKNTAGFMRIAATVAGSHEAGNTEILVMYRYTRFSRTSRSGRRGGVVACRRTKRHWLRFAVPPAGAGDDMGSALAWAGSSLGPLIYPGLFRRELGDLWRSLAVSASTVIPRQATRLLVLVDAGILRREDYTAERMDDVRGALEATAREAWGNYYHVVMELQLPEPAVLLRRHEEEGGGDESSSRPAKRRRRVVPVAEGEECSLCMDPLESGGLAAWPGCGHVFHGRCVEQTLASRPTCPLCRHHLCSGAFVR